MSAPEKVFRKLNLALSDDVVQQAASAKPGAIELILLRLMAVLPEAPQPNATPHAAVKANVPSATHYYQGHPAETMQGQDSQSQEDIQLMPESYTHLRLQQQQQQYPSNKAVTQQTSQRRLSSF